MDEGVTARIGRFVDERVAGRQTRRLVLLTVVAWVVARLLGGVDQLHAVLIALGVAVVVVAVVLGRDGVAAHWEAQGRSSHEGARLEVAALSWSMLGRDGLVGEGAVRRVRALASVRLARCGLDLADPADHDEIRARLGAVAWWVLRNNERLPTRREIEACVRALEEITPVEGRRP